MLVVIAGCCVHHPTYLLLLHPWSCLLLLHPQSYLLPFLVLLVPIFEAVSSSNIPATSLIALSWVSLTGANRAPCLCCCNAAVRFFAACVAASSADMCGSLVFLV
eukprot:15086540-Ditylum_brightwellii.AAC.1